MPEQSEIFEKIYSAFVEEIPVFLAFSESERMKIFLRIVQHGAEGISVNDIASKSHLSRPAVSHHLKVLKDSNLISAKKVGTKIFYSADCKERFIELQNNLHEISHGFEEMNLGRIKDDKVQVEEMIDVVEKTSEK